MPIADINGVPLCYKLGGSGGVPTVLVHGGWGSHEQWDEVFSRLAHSCTVLSYDRRGHSESGGEGSVHDDVNDLAALIESQGIAPAFVVGNSFGSVIALRLAASRPDLVRGIVLHEPPLFPLLASDPGGAGTLNEFIRQIGDVVQKISVGDHAEAAVQFMTELALAPGEWEQLPESLKQTVVHNAPTFVDVANDPDALQFDLSSIDAFSGPVLLTVGERSPSNYALVLDKLAAALPHAERRMFKGAGHLPHVTHPAAYFGAVQAFLAAHAW